jgi:uncharacterized protein YjbI with pentapeptide repeats
MISRWRPREHQPARPLSNLAIAVGAVIVLGVGAVAWTVLLWRYGSAGPGVELDAVRTAGTVTVAAGGAAALLLAARRQVHTERDSGEQRITELYTRAVDQLGNGQAPVRLGGLHALERLAKNNPAQRQTIVDVICAYLRMPYTPPADDHAPGEDAPEDAHRRYEQSRQELQVRLTAQRILSTHLQPEEAAVFWPNIDLDLTDAYLYQLDLTACHVRRALFDGAKFADHAMFREMTFASDAQFNDAEFFRSAQFGMAEFFGSAEFDGTKFFGNAHFGEAEFSEFAQFREAEFFVGAQFGEAKLSMGAWFVGAKFSGHTWFGEAIHTEYIEFDRARVDPNSSFEVPRGWTTRAARPAEGEDEAWLYMVRDEESSERSILPPPRSPRAGPGLGTGRRRPR